MNKLKRAIVSLVLAGCMVVGGNAMAQTSLLTGGFLSNGGNALQNSDSTSPWIDSLAWNSFFDTTSAPPPNFYGEVGTWVSNSDSLNPFGSGSLTFLYQFVNCDSSVTYPSCGGKVSTDAITRWTLTGFDGYKTSVAYTTAWSGIDMVLVDRFNSNNIGVSYASVHPGQAGNLIVYTNATSYGTSTSFFQDGGQGNAAIFAPIPEPETYAMLLAGLGLMGFVARRRRQNAAA